MSSPNHKRLKRAESKDLFSDSENDEIDSSQKNVEESQSKLESISDNIVSQANSGHSEFTDFMKELGEKRESQNLQESQDDVSQNPSQPNVSQSQSQPNVSQSQSQPNVSQSQSQPNGSQSQYQQNVSQNQSKSQQDNVPRESQKLTPGVSERKDPDYAPNNNTYSETESSQSESQDFESQEAEGGDKYENLVNEAKVIVSITSLLTLFKFCRDCGAPVSEPIHHQVGACLTVTTTCLNHHTLTWSSSPKIGSGSKSRYVINILMATVNLTIGGTFESMNKLFSQLRIHSLSKSQYYNILGDFVYKVIWYIWVQHQAEMFDELRNIKEDIEMIADGSYDSPGFTALYCIVFLFCVNIGKCVSFKVVHKSQTNNASTKMESFGVRCCLEEVLQENIVPARLGTDQCGHVKTMMRDFYSFIKRENEIWHWIKNVRKDIRKAGKTVSCEILGLWEESITNQLWYAFESCQQDVVILKEKILSIIGHCCNKHEFPSFEKYTHCEHRDLSNEPPRPWLTYDSEACRKLQEILKGRDGGRFNALEDMAFSMKTHMVESMNNKRIVYSPKRLVFQPKQQMARTILCCLDNNFNSERGQAVTKEGTPRFKIQTNRSGHKWFVKKIMNQNSYEIMDEIRILVLQCIDTDFVPAEEMPVDNDIPKNIARVPRPDKDKAVATHISRFKKS